MPWNVACQNVRGPCCLFLFCLVLVCSVLFGIKIVFTKQHELGDLKAETLRPWLDSLATRAALGKSPTSRNVLIYEGCLFFFFLSRYSMLTPSKCRQGRKPNPVRIETFGTLEAQASARGRLFRLFPSVHGFLPDRRGSGKLTRLGSGERRL